MSIRRPRVPGRIAAGAQSPVGGTRRTPAPSRTPAQSRTPETFGTLLVVLAVLLGGCVPLASGTSPVPAASQAPPAAAVAQTAAALESAYRQAGFGFIQSSRPYRPSEPPDLIAAPRTVYQVVLPKDPGAGYVVIYQATGSAEAQTLAASMQGYLQSGFGQTNFPTDARFAVQGYGSTVLFGWYSPGASADPAAAASALEVLQSFGQAFPVVR